MPVRAVDRFVAPRSSSTPVLRVGSRGAAVRQMQALLRTAGYRLVADGIFGNGTLAAVRAFQRRRGLGADGIVGAKTWAALRGRAPRASRTRPTPAATGRTIAATGYRNGRPVRIRLAAVGNGVYLNSRAAGPYKAMLSAARRAGIRLSTTSGFRSHASQTRLYSLYKSGRGNMAARPGYSNHQMGLSVDIGGVGGYRTRAFKWLKANAPRYGFVNDVRGEYWHWTFRR